MISSSLNSPTTNVDTTDSHAKRNDLLQRLTEVSSDGGISAGSNRDPEPAGGGEPSRPSTRSRTTSSTANQSTAANRMSLRLPLVGTSLLWIPALLTTDS